MCPHVRGQPRTEFVGNPYSRPSAGRPRSHGVDAGKASGNAVSTVTRDTLAALPTDALGVVGMIANLQVAVMAQEELE